MVDTPNDADSPSSIQSEHESLIARFEKLWNAGQSPRIEDFLPNDRARLAVLAELVIAELEFRFRAGQDPKLEEYLERFPELLLRKEIAILLAKEEFRRRKGRLESVNASEFASRFPALSPELERELASTLESLSGGESAELQKDPKSAEVATNLSEMKWLAKGGMGEVYVALDNVLKRRVAMKVIQTKYERNSEALRRFVTEAEITSRLEHPGIAPVYGVGSLEDGRPCYAMRYIRGESMGDAIRRFFSYTERPTSSKSSSASPSANRDASRSRLDLHVADRNLSFRLLLQRFVAVCYTLGYAHQRGVLHRDLKPDNIRLGEHGETILLDWGLAKDLDPQLEGEGSIEESNSLNQSDASKTKIGSIYGTPQFMSPEQARREGGVLTPAADIYGLGATLYYLLTGHPPFAKDSPSKIVERVGRGDFLRPQSICRDAPAALEAICLKAMHLRPSDRYLSANAMAEDVERFLADEAINVFVDSIATRFRRWIVRHRTVASIALTVCFAGLASLTMWSFISAKHAQVLETKNGELQTANHQTNEALKIQTLLTNTIELKNLALEKANAAEVAAANEVRLQRDAANLRSQQVLGLTKSIVELVSVSGPDGLRINSKGDWSSKSMNRFSTPEYLDRVIAELNTKFPPNDPVRGTVLAAVGQTKRSIGMFEEAAPLLAEALRVREQQGSKFDPESADIEFDLGWCLVEIQGRVDEAVKHFRNVIAARKQAVPRDNSAIGLAQAGLMFALFVQETPLWQILLEIAPEAVAISSNQQVNILGVYTKFRAAEEARRQRNWKLGDELYVEVANGIAKIVPDGHPARAASDFMMAGYLRDRGDLRRAEDYVLRAMKVYREKVGTHTYMCEPLFQIACYREQFGDFDEAELLHREAFWLAHLNLHLRRGFRSITTQGLTSFLVSVGKNEETIAMIDTALSGPDRMEGDAALELQARRIQAWMALSKFATVISNLPLEQAPNRFLPNPQSIHSRCLIELGRWEEAKAIMPIVSHISWDEIVPRPVQTNVNKLQRLHRYDPRSAQGIETQLATDPIARDHAGSVGVLRILAMKKAELGDFETARQLLYEASNISQRRLSTQDKVFIELIVDSATINLLEKKLDAAMDDVKRMATAAQARFGVGSLGLANFLYDAGLISLYAGDKSLASTYFDAVIKIRSSRWTGANSQIWSPILHRMEATPDPRLRQDFLNEQLRQMSMQGVSSWRIAVLTRELGAVQRELGNYRAAEKSLLDAWKTFEPMLGVEHAVSQATSAELLKVYTALNRPTEAEDWSNRIIPK